MQPFVCTFLNDLEGFCCLHFVTSLSCVTGKALIPTNHLLTSEIGLLLANMNMSQQCLGSQEDHSCAGGH